MSGPPEAQEDVMKTIVVGYDATEPARRALERAAVLAQAFGARVVVTTVAQGTAAGASGTPRELTEAQELLARSGIAVELRAADGDPADAIVDVAHEAGADLIVVGARERSTVRRLLGGSVTDAVSRHAHCDVLIVH